MNKSLTVEQLIEKLHTLDSRLEVFVANETTAVFDGLTSVAEIMSKSDNKRYVIFVAGGDILKI